MYLPSKSLKAPLRVPFTITFAKGRISLYYPSFTVPVMIPDCENEEKESKLIISNNKDVFFMVIIYKNNSSQ